MGVGCRRLLVVANTTRRFMDPYDTLENGLPEGNKLATSTCVEVFRVP